ncbi:GtrA family protein [Candidatus Rickettsiella viridis]|uniref:GtrA family protein n=1 Tax=Candidatus Rickettsiella viridis TaxID=676208 RepID=A0A2Z5UTI7_9COXI|nr:GtrA family protein [Candidatus Rickettsiella viridis]BBB14754.1 GtrA family protein [Candidatus Rickettsiella viridis]
MKALFWQFSRFFIVGASSALVQFSILIGLVELFSVKPIVASTLGYLGGALINYLLNHYFTFKSTLPHRQAVLRFSINSLFGLFVNFVMMAFLLRHYPYVLSQVLTSMVVLIWNFLIHRYWTFHSKKKVI